MFGFIFVSAEYNYQLSGDNYAVQDAVHAIQEAHYAGPVVSTNTREDSTGNYVVANVTPGDNNAQQVVSTRSREQPTDSYVTHNGQLVVVHRLCVTVFR